MNELERIHGQGFSHRVDHAVLGLFVEIGMHRQAEHLMRQRLRALETGPGPWEPSVGGESVEGSSIVNGDRNP